jgi:flagellar basal-body rod protein FlgB
VSFAVSDPVSQVLHTALNGLSMRQDVIADDIANVDTPNYTAHSIDFEDALKQAIASGAYDDGGSPQVSVSTTPDSTPVGSNGNNVDQRKETMAMIQTQYSYQVVSRAISDHYGLLQTAATQVK